MKTELKKVYYCDHCKKHNLSASAISRHEKYCPSNPGNKHKCFDMCKFLERERVFGGSYPVTKFNCLKTGVKLYSFILEKHKSIWPYHIKFDGLVRMPLTCDRYLSMSYDQIEERFFNESE
jgi:hypothetical protein